MSDIHTTDMMIAEGTPTARQDTLADVGSKQPTTTERGERR
ncbi:hypothetical protein [Halogranum amylolyticum]|nr:hypothetical protein [Halogranum amylolyticum]